jgi:spore coat protein A, manganese oxidase
LSFLKERRPAMTSRRISRKEFLGIGAGAAAGVALAGSGMGTFSTRQAAATPPLLTYSVPLPVPPVLRGTTQSLDIEQTYHRFHTDLPPSRVWGYNDGVKKSGGYLGPSIEVQKNTTTTVNFINNLPDTHLLPVTTELVPDGTDAPRILTHLHGGFVSGANDDNPYATETLFFKGNKQTAVYPPQPRATTLWYHDHAMGMTRLNVYAGLAGFFVVRDTNDTGREPNPIGIPGGKYEVPIVIQDKTFDAEGRLFYSQDATWMPEFFGETPVVNGAVQPYLTVEPRMYRFRFLNGSQSRFYHLKLEGGVPFYQIDSEGGMFDIPVRATQILLLPAERVDVIVDFRGLAGQDIVLRNVALPGGVVSPADPEIPELMQFRVRGPLTTPGPRTIPSALNGGAKANLANKTPLKRRYITLEEVLDEATGDPDHLELNGRRFMDAVDEASRAGSIEDWAFVNISADTHPIHMHLTNFQVMKRQTLEGERYKEALEAARNGATGSYPLLANNTIDPTPFLVPDSEMRPDPNERGWKDTVRADPDQVTWIRQKFALPQGVGAPQKYVYHCHILEHEENDMMRPYEVV